MSEFLHFKISSGLKNIIGRELITDKYIAIFELVKNAYDAKATNVVISFENIGTQDAKISISDDGLGMDKNSIIDKWLHVAYSEKKNPSYRDSIDYRNYAGAKGIGRFSCDRLGASVELISTIENSYTQHKVRVNWNDFEVDDNNDFASINVLYESDQIDKEKHGTTIIITALRESWDRKNLLHLKKSLSQLVNPNATEKYDVFSVKIYAPTELTEDKEQKEEYDKVNGEIRNYVFEALYIKTTKIEVSISEDGKTIDTTLTDRGTDLFSMTEKNEFSLKNITCYLYYLNPTAKRNFTKIMGIQPVNYGSVFVYKNGFRVFPYGEPDLDFFNVNQRKGQGQRRYLGTREIMGRIEIAGLQRDLIETSSRNHGFIETPSYLELDVFFMEYVLKPLEKYVVNIIQWGVSDDLINDDLFHGDIRNFENLIRKLKPRTKESNILSLDFNNDLIGIIESRKAKPLLKATEDLQKIAYSQNNEDLHKAVKAIEKETSGLQGLVKDISKENERTQHKLETTSAELAITQKQIGILEARADLTADEALSAMHIMKGYADAIDSLVDEIYDIIKNNGDSDNKVMTLLGDISRTSRKVKKSYELVMGSRYSANTELSKNNIVTFCIDYSKIVTGYNIKLDVQADNEFNTNINFNPLEFSIIIDNLLSNAQKANATVLRVGFNVRDGFLYINFRDDGVGLSNEITSPERIFESGFFTTRGTGIGLQTVKKYLNKIGGTIYYNSDYTEGFELIVKVKL